MNEELDKYQTVLGIGSGLVTDREKALNELLNISLNNRENEIKRYWTRSTYFWVFVSFLFTVYGMIFSTNIFNVLYIKQFILSFLAAMGGVFSFVWYLVTKSSKYWQENWEYHTEYLTKILYGDLFGVLKNPNKQTICSPTKLNQKVSGFITLICLIAFSGHLTEVWILIFPEYQSTCCYALIFIVLLIVVAILIIYLCKSTSSTYDQKIPSEWYINRNLKK